jgi:twitching motility protein PilT
MDKSFSASTPMAEPATTRAVPTPGAHQAAAAAFNFKAVLQRMIQQNASDLHLKVGRPPVLRINGELQQLDLPPLKPEDLKQLAEQIMTPKQVKEFTENKEADFAIGVPGIGRFRVNVFQQRGTIAYALRLVPYQVKNCTELNLPPVVEEIAMKPRGLVLVGDDPAH